MQTNPAVEQSKIIRWSESPLNHPGRKGKGLWTYEIIAINHVCLLSKIDFLGYIFVAEYGSNFNHCDVVGPTEFGEMMQNNGNNGIQGHCRSPILVPTESAHAISYVW